MLHAGVVGRACQSDLTRITLINPIPPRLFEGGSAWRAGGGGEGVGGWGWKVPAAYNSKTILNDNEMK